MGAYGRTADEIEDVEEGEDDTEDVVAQGIHPPPLLLSRRFVHLSGVVTRVRQKKKKK